jgi:hypothetical protein
MAEYLPLHDDGDSITRQASATITGGQMVMVSGSGTVATATAGVSTWLGVAAADAVSGDNLTVFTSGVQRITASGTVTAGDLVVTAASGQVATVAAVSTPTAGDVTSTRGLVGLALTTATNGNLVEVKLAR